MGQLPRMETSSGSGESPSRSHIAVSRGNEASNEIQHENQDAGASASSSSSGGIFTVQTPSLAALRREDRRASLSQRSFRRQRDAPISTRETAPEISTIQVEIDAARQGESSALPIAGIRDTLHAAVESSASNLRGSPSSVFGRARGPLSEGERRLKREGLRSVFYGYASEEDLSQIGSSAAGDLSRATSTSRP